MIRLSKEMTRCSNSFGVDLGQEQSLPQLQMFSLRLGLALCRSPEALGTAIMLPEPINYGKAVALRQYQVEHH